MISLLGILVPSFGYPLLLWILSTIRSFWVPKNGMVLLKGDELPTVSFLLSAYNEQAVLKQKLENTLDLDYPKDKIEVFVLSDASTDQTDVIAEAFADRGVRLKRSESRVGKSANITCFLPETQGSIIIFSDANSMYNPDAVLHLVSHFSDPKVGYVVGVQRYRSKLGGERDAEGKYWEIELKIKAWESNLSSVVGADGAIFAMRKSLFEPLGESDISDFLGPLRIVSKGYLGVFEPKAICYEGPVTSMSRNFSRKVRIITRSLQAVTKVPSVLLPWRTGWFSIQVWLHKVLRWMSPLFLLLLIGGAWGDAWRGLLFGKMLLGMIAVWLCLASLYLIPVFRRSAVVSAACYCFLVNVAAFVGLIWLLLGRKINFWRPDR